MLRILMLLLAVIAMADGGGSDGDEGGGEGGGDDPGGDPEALGDAGKRALQAERQAARQAAREKHAAEQRAKEAEAKLAEYEDRDATEQEKAVKKAAAEARKEAAEAVRTEYRRRILEMEMRAAAAGKLHTPGDAIALLDLDAYDVDDEDLSDTLSAAIDVLVEEKPYLAADYQPTKKPGDADGGTKPPADPDDRKLTPNERLRRAYS